MSFELLEPSFLVSIPGWIPGVILLFAAIIGAAYIKSLLDMRRARAANRRIQERQEARVRKSEADLAARGEPISEPRDASPGTGDSPPDSPDGQALVDS